MTNRVAYAPEDFKKMCRRSDRDHESRKLVLLLDRVKKQIAARENSRQYESPKPPATAMAGDGRLSLVPSSAPFER